MDILPVTPDQIIQFVGITLIPIIVDAIRVGVFQLAMRYKWQFVADLTSHPKFGIVVTYVTCLVFGAGLAIWLGGVAPTIENLSETSLAILGWATLLYKFFGYEKSEVRKSVTRVADKIGPKSEEIDTQETEITVG